MKQSKINNKTIERAKQAVREINRNMTSDIIVYLREGVYCPENTLSFGAEDSGTNGYYVKYTSFNGEKVKISGGDKITGWEKYDNKIWKASYVTDNYVRQLYINDKRARRAHKIPQICNAKNNQGNQFGQSSAFKG